jgi:triosephosphate isomerase
MRQPLVAGNWKLNGSLETILELVSGIANQLPAITNTELAVCPPAVYLGYVQQLLDGVDISLGAQDCSVQESGAYTGELAAAMIKEFDCKYIIIGHSERRHIYGESNETVAIKFEQVKNNSLIPILCVGETLQNREDGHTKIIISQQLDVVLERSGVESFTDAVIAYEPVWAIGTGKTATPEQAQEVHEFIRSKLNAKNKDIAANIRILYGGSMKPHNAKQLLEQNDIDGGLIGGASLKVEDFIGIAVAAN